MEAMKTSSIPTPNVEFSEFFLQVSIGKAQIPKWGGFVFLL